MLHIHKVIYIYNVTSCLRVGAGIALQGLITQVHSSEIMRMVSQSSVQFWSRGHPQISTILATNEVAMARDHLPDRKLALHFFSQAALALYSRPALFQPGCSHAKVRVPNAASVHYPDVPSHVT